MEIVDELNFYDEKMLRLQYEISECFSHQLTKGEIREEFIKEYIKNKTGNDKILKGAIYKGVKESTQLDMIICNNNIILEIFYINICYFANIFIYFLPYIRKKYYSKIKSLIKV